MRLGDSVKYTNVLTIKQSILILESALTLSMMADKSLWHCSVEQAPLLRNRVVVREGFLTA